ncbi:MAG: ATPase domain-containing protein, partial [Thermoplasmata archaeon]
MLHGGLIPGRPYIVSGQLGTGKTTLAIQFLLEGVKNGENVLYITTEEPPNEIKKNFESFNWDISKIKVFDAIPDVMTYEITPIKDITALREIVPFRDVPYVIRKTPEHGSPEMTFNALQNALKLALSTSEYDRIVVDSLTALKFFCIPSYDHNLGVQSFIRFLSELKVTTLLTVEMPLEYQFEPELFLARGEIRLLKWRDKSGELKRGVLIEKYKGSSHDVHLRPMEITSDGIVIYSELHVEKSPLEAYLEAIPMEAAEEEMEEKAPEAQEKKEVAEGSGPMSKTKIAGPEFQPVQPSQKVLEEPKQIPATEPLQQAELEKKDLVDRVRADTLLKEIKILRADAGDADLIGIDVRDIMEILDKADSFISSGKLADVEEAITTARRLLDERINLFQTGKEVEKVSGESGGVAITQHPAEQLAPPKIGEAEKKAEKPAKKPRKKKEKKEEKEPVKEKKERKRKQAKKEVG